MPFSIFDILVVIFVIIGAFVGRKHGLSQEISRVMIAVTALCAPALACRLGDDPLAHYASISLLWSRIAIYMGVLMLVFILMTAVKNALQDRMIAKNWFGDMEYPLGVMAGMFRFFCILLIGMALLHAPAISNTEKENTAKTQKENFGSVSFPTLSSMQDFVFRNSFTGRFAAQYLDSVLIPSVRPGQMSDAPPPSKPTLKKRE